jgi:hypothetical protein
MASRKRERPVQADGRDGSTYRQFMAAFVTGSVVATSVDDTTVSDGNQQITLKRFDNGTPQADTPHNVPKRRLTKFEYNDPNG